MPVNRRRGAGARAGGPASGGPRLVQVYRNAFAVTRESGAGRLGVFLPGHRFLGLQVGRPVARDDGALRRETLGTWIAPLRDMPSRWRSVCIVVTPGSGEGRARAVARRLGRLLRRRGSAVTIQAFDDLPSLTAMGEEPAGRSSRRSAASAAMPPRAPPRSWPGATGSPSCRSRPASATSSPASSVTRPVPARRHGCWTRARSGWWTWGWREMSSSSPTRATASSTRSRRRWRTAGASRGSASGACSRTTAPRCGRSGARRSPRSASRWMGCWPPIRPCWSRWRTWRPTTTS